MPLEHTPSGRRDLYVTIQARAEDAADPAGYPSETFSTLAREWMSKQEAVRFDRSSERFEGGQITARSFLEWRLPYRQDMDPDVVDVPKMRRLLLNGRVHDITEAELVDRHEIKLTTLARVG